MDDHPFDRPIAPEQKLEEPTETLADLRAQVERYKNDAERNWQQFLRTAADLENYKKQATRQRDDAVQRTRALLLGVVLEVVDNLERALEHAANGGGNDAVVEGIRMTHRHVLDVLANMGIRPMQATGKAFDPKVHEAVDVASSTALGVDPGTVVGEVQRGYTLQGEVLRPARVRVAK